MAAGDICECYKIGIYVRESRDDNEENYDTIETQRDMLIDFVKKNRFGEIRSIYVDDNVSGSAFEREGLKRLKDDVVSGTVNLLVLKDLSRLGRNNAKTLLFLDFLEEYGVRVITFDGRYDSTRDNDTVGIDTWFNERYVRDISRKIRTNIRFKIQKGEYLGHAPYGYVKSTLEKNRLCIDSGTAHVVREIFSLYREGYGYQYIARQLNLKGYPVPSNKSMNGGPKDSWNPVAVQRILSNRVYIGDTVQGISEKISFKSKKTRRLPASRWVITENTHDALISKEEFEEVQRIRNERNRHSGTHKGTLHMFKGMLFCGRCGSMMFARVRKNRPIGYICGNYAKNGINGCSSHHISEEAVQSVIMQELMELFGDEKLMTRVRKLLESDLSRNNERTNGIEKLQENLIIKQRQQDTLYMDKLEGKISDQMFSRINTGLENKISQLQSEIERQKNMEEDRSDIEHSIDRAKGYFIENGMFYEVVRLIVERILVFDKSDIMDALELSDRDIETARRNGVIVVEFRYAK